MDLLFLPLLRSYNTKCGAESSDGDHSNGRGGLDVLPEHLPVMIDVRRVLRGDVQVMEERGDPDYTDDDHDCAQAKENADDELFLKTDLDFP